MKRILFSALLAVILFSACKSGATSTEATTSNVNDSTAAVNAINKADSLWDAQSAINSVPGWLGFYSDDAIILPPGDIMVKDKVGREKVIAGYFALPAASMRFQATKTEVSKSGDLGYSTGNYQFSFKDSTGKVVKDNGKFNEIWKKQADGSWKCVLDTWNSDPAK